MFDATTIFLEERIHFFSLVETHQLTLHVKRNQYIVRVEHTKNCLKSIFGQKPTSLNQQHKVVQDE
jgi:hypothetical protein